MTSTQQPRTSFLKLSRSQQALSRISPSSSRLGPFSPAPAPPRFSSSSQRPRPEFTQSQQRVSGAFWPGFDVNNFKHSPAGIRDELCRCIRLRPGFRGHTIRESGRGKYTQGIFDIINNKWVEIPLTSKNIKCKSSHPGRPRREDAPCPLRIIILNAFYFLKITIPRDVAAIIKAVFTEWKKADKLLHQAQARDVWKKKKQDRASLLPAPLEAIRATADRMKNRLAREKERCPSCNKSANCSSRFHRKPEEWVRWWDNHIRKSRLHDNKSRRHVRQLLQVENASLPARKELENSIRLVSFNISSLQKNGVEFLHCGPKADLYALQETRLGRSKFYGSGITDYTLYNFARPSGSGGGTAIWVRPHTPFEALPQFKHRVGDLGPEAYGGRLNVFNERFIYIISVYLPPGRPSTEVETACQTWQNWILQADSEPDCLGIIFLGDLNAFLLSTDDYKSLGMRGSGARTKWLLGRKILRLLSGTDRLPRTIINDLIDRRNGGTNAIYSHSSIHGKSCIDYGLLFGHREIIKTVYFSDEGCAGLGHRPLVVEVSLLPTAPPPPRRYRIFKLDTVDEHGKFPLREQLNTKFTAALSDVDNIGIPEFNTIVHSSFKEVCGLSRVRKRISGKDNPFWTPHLTTLGRALKRARRRAHLAHVRGLDHLDFYKNEVKSLRKDWLKAIASAQVTFWNEKRSSWSSESESLHNAFLIINSRKKSFIPFSEGEISSAWSPILSAPPPDGCSEAADRTYIETLDWGDLSNDHSISFDEVKAAIDSLCKYKAQGTDEINNAMLRSLPDCAILCLQNIFNRILSNPSNIPLTWKEAHIILIPKKEDSPSPTDFRPITLLSNTAKVLEKILWTRAKTWGVPLQFTQGGFAEDRGCPEQAWQLKIMQDALRFGKQNGTAILLDAKKAYDSVPHYTLIRRLLEIPCIPRYFCKFVLHWVTGHKRKLIVNGTASKEWIPVNKGVPQGSILAPFLFNIYIDPLLRDLTNLPGLSVNVRDLNHDPKTFKLSTLGYADDILVAISSAREWSRAKDICETFAKASGLTWNVPKTVSIDIGGGCNRKRQPLLTLGNENIQQVKSCDYLGYRFQTIGGKFLQNPRFVEKLYNEEIRGVFRHFDSAQHCPLLVGRLIVTLRHLPQLLYGSECLPLQVKSRLEAAWAAIHRRVLGGYHTDSHDKAKTFLGIRPLYLYRRRRLITFTLKIASGNFPSFFNLLTSGWNTSLPWFVDTRKEFLSAHSESWFVDADGVELISPADISNFGSFLLQLPQDSIQKLCVSMINAVNCHWNKGKIKEHPFCELNPKLQPQLAFRFISGNFNPRDIHPDKDDVPQCLLCSVRQGDRPEHLVRCFDPRVELIKLETLTSMHRERSSEQILGLETLLECPTTERLKEYKVVQHEYEHIARALFRLWRLRSKAWKRAKLNSGSTYGSHAKWKNWKRSSSVAAAPRARSRRSVLPDPPQINSHPAMAPQPPRDGFSWIPGVRNVELANLILEEEAEGNVEHVQSQPESSISVLSLRGILSGVDPLYNRPSGNPSSLVSSSLNWSQVDQPRPFSILGNSQPSSLRSSGLSQLSLSAQLEDM